MIGMPSLKERIENNAAILFCGAAIAGSGAGYGTHSAIAGSPLFGAAPPVDWQATAKEKGWIERNTCPGLPIVLRILSPGDNATVEYSTGDLSTDLIISSTQPLPGNESVGFVMNAEGDTNFYVDFPYFEANEQRTSFRDSRFVKIRKKIEKPTHVDIWAVLIDDKRKLGSVYGSLDQIKAVSDTVFLSNKIGINIVPTK
jgi:hypothetical protein